jgi:acyl-CoA reductase-like NAD-dependent aldehyde dehydrogenase
MKIINPATEELIKEIQEDSQKSVQEKYSVLKNGQIRWAETPLEERIACIQKFYDLLDSEKDSLAKTLSLEVGKPLSQSHNELKGARNRIKFFLDNSKKWLTEEWMVTEGGTKEKITYEPLGVIANISAWNYPYLVGVNVFIPALIGGNAVLYKPSEYSTLTGLEIERLLHKAGIPGDVFKCISGGRETGQSLLELPLDGYFFTGSYKTGLAIAQKVSSKLVPFQMELGGKDPVYVMDDIEDVKSSAAGIADGAFYNNGQSCCSVERIYVHENIYDRFVKEFTEEVKTYKTGNPLEEGVYIGPLTRKDQIEVLSSQIKDAVDKGAKLLCGGKETGNKGYFFEPAVLVNVNHSMTIMKDESFGPVIGIQKVPGDEEALKLMNDTEYGLTAAVYSKDKNRADKILRRLNTGSVYWNCCDRVSPYLPWSGRKNSGLGATLSYIGIRAFVKPKGYHLRGN